MGSRSLIDSIQEWLHLKTKSKQEGLDEPPMPVEIFSAEQMERYGITLALSHVLTHESIKDILLKGLDESESELLKAQQILAKKTTESNGFSPARDWLLDNFYLIQEQILHIRHNLPKGYGRSLPKLVTGYPRIYDIALQIIEHSDGHWDIESLNRFINSYQGITPLTLGELWATPICLGIALIENLAKASKRIILDQKEYGHANRWADRMIDVASSDPKELVVVIAEMAHAEIRMSSAFVAELARRLQSASLTLPLSWIEQHLAPQGLTIEQLIQEENKHLAANQLTISNSVAGLRHLSDINWRVFVEKMSIVEKILKRDPADAYSNMDFASRDSYRHVVEELARLSHKSEKEVAESSLHLANTFFENKLKIDPNFNKYYGESKIERMRYSHVGYYLIEQGRKLLEKELQLKFTILRSIRHFSEKWTFRVYSFSILMITAILSFALISNLIKYDLHIINIFILGLLILILTSQIAVSLVNLASTLIVKPKLLPRMDFSKGIPENFRTIVVVPALLTHESGIENLIENLEIRFLGNRVSNLLFALLTDFNDAPNEHMPSDDKILNFAKEQIEKLNKQYSETNNDLFYLLHRPRVWNSKEDCWMGVERKRGKLSDLNNLLTNNDTSAFSLITGNSKNLSNIKYVITLDTDTQLARETADQYVGTMVHPLNRPRIDFKKDIVVEGYGILQPRVAEGLPDKNLTPFLWLFGNEFGIDPYTKTVSDVYQDLFGEGSFIGKGIYDVYTFQQVLSERLPDNSILSHDLLEGCYLRSGFVSDVPLYEKSPSSFYADAKRRARWIRGDWQISGWTLPFVRTKKEKFEINPLSNLSKLKIFDNLRRSLVAPALLLLFGLDWAILPETCFWFGIILVIVLLPSLINILLEVVLKPIDTILRQHALNIFQRIEKNTLQLILYLTCLPFETWYSLTAIIRTIYRMFVSKRHLLEWTPSDQINQQVPVTIKNWIRVMWIGPLASIIAIFLLFIHHRIECLSFAFPLITLWFFSPIIARWISSPIKIKEPKLKEEQKRFLHKMARKTWAFFDHFVTVEDHWLPPDNFQEIPVEKLARRTSPTNIGLYLLANLTAYDFGYITMSQLLERTSNTLKTLNKMERYRGHFYNWYSTENLEPLLPRYVSTVDSGNLAGHLLTLLQGLQELIEGPLLNSKYLNGLEDTLDILLETQYNSSEFTQLLIDFRKLISNSRQKFENWSTAIQSCNELNNQAEQIKELSLQIDAESEETSNWTTRLLLQCRSIQDEIQLYKSITEIDRDSTLKKLGYKTQEKIIQIQTLCEQITALSEMDISFLVDNESHLMTIGFNVDEQKMDLSRYDLLASEARLGNFVAVAQGQILQECWFALGRLVVSNAFEPILISWSGSMFEYLMPLLVMPSYPGTILHQTCLDAVDRQIAYGKQRKLPWGLSESGYNAVDTQFNYLYRAFGVPGLGLKRGLEDDYVITPYASALALMVSPSLACNNLQLLASQYKSGNFGFYEAIDFTPSRLPPDGSQYAIVRSFMTHHQGMIFLSFSFLLNNQPMQRRFSGNPELQSTLLLLQERIPKRTGSYLKIPKAPHETASEVRPETLLRIFNSPNTRTPQVQLLSNANYHLVITQAGGGYSRWKEYMLTRWREDSTCDNWGLFTYIRDLSTGEYCSTIYSPTMGSVENFKVVFGESHAEFTRADMLLDMHSEIVVSPEDDLELRRLRIHNRSRKKRIIEFTSYAELVLTTQAADLAQPAFNNLFIETKILKEQQAIVATRRTRDEHENPPWLCHLLIVYTDHEYEISFETDRSRFVGRCHTNAHPIVLLEEGNLSNSQGAVLDPIIAIRCRLTMEPDDLVIFDLFTGASDSKENCISFVNKYQDRRLANRIFELAWTHGQVMLHQLNISEEEAQLFGKLASAIIYSSRNRRAEPRILASNRKGQSGLWSYAISGDLPIVVLYIEEVENIELVRQLIKAKNYLRRKGLFIDLIIINEEGISYRQTLQDQLMSLVTAANTSDHMGSIILRTSEQVPSEDNILFQSVARIIISDKNGTLHEQLRRHRVTPPHMPNLQLSRLTFRHGGQNTLPLPQDLQFFNGFGGFNKTGDEYIIHLTENVNTPAPWANVIANPNFGTLISECGQGYTWFENAHEYRLTPWENDPLQDSASEAIYIRDDETGSFWCPTALPYRGKGDYQTRHGFGYSTFEHIEDGIHSELCITVSLNNAIKFISLKIHNTSNANRKLSVSGFIAWVLGDLRTKSALHVVTEVAPGGVILAQNHYNTDFSEYVAFYNVNTVSNDLTAKSLTCDRAEFIGRNGSLQNPISLKRKRLSGRSGAGLDPCAAYLLSFELAKDQTREIVFTLGAGKNKKEALDLYQHYHDMIEAKTTLTEVKQYWFKRLSPIRVNTPDPAINLLTNGWLIYQVLSSRLWGRTGYYQSGGAFGYRDQLQDVLSLSHLAPDLFRAHLLLCAAHQFEEGDVQHWWHPPHNRGVRTRCSDDYLWLPFALCHYIETTGDFSILDENIPFLEGRPLKPDEESYYELPIIGSKAYSLYKHAITAIKHGLKFGQHGLPLMGSGDWNDGMNLVGKDGKGESVWLAFFLYTVLKRFSKIATKYNDETFAHLCETEKNTLRQNIEAHAWDGQWYRRAYFNDGSPLGSENNIECKIDSISQSWAVLSGAAESSRRKQAMEAVYKYLVEEKDGLIKLLTPPFDKSKPNPGYIEGYLPGIRENGGQYTHAAVWTIMAYAEMGETEMAWKLLNLINPINHGRNLNEVQQYKIEAYVVAADVYSVAPHIGRGGWSWYTGSAGWLYRLITETMLGIQLIDGKYLEIKPLLPENWGGFTVNYSYKNSEYKIVVQRGSGKTEILLDKKPIEGNLVPLEDDTQVHEIMVNIRVVNL